MHSQKEFAEKIGRTPETISKVFKSDKKLSPSTAYRLHTFATWMLSQGISLDSVSVMVGHTNTVQTRRYAKTLAKTVRDDFDKVAEKLKTAISSQT